MQRQCAEHAAFQDTFASAPKSCEGLPQEHDLYRANLSSLRSYCRLQGLTSSELMELVNLLQPGDYQPASFILILGSL
jgi:hypothetical protein